ncbi:heterokaryon incompatibility protein-domain-containing protein [Phyllosticta capitalensis]
MITSFFHSPESIRTMPECVLELYSLPGDAAHDWIGNRPVTTSIGGDENLRVVRGWLDECQSNHAFCRRNDHAETPLPTRLIKIVDGGAAQLIETQGQNGRYVALSYCWGQDPGNNSMTTSDNVHLRLEPRSLSRKDLPGAIRDALTVTERLGIEYIWVDALCIIQDDAKDKDRELGNMSQYYRSSFLTIAASTPRCSTGFMGTMGRCQKHPDSQLPKDLVPFNVFCISRDKDEGKSGELLVREENPYQLSEEYINKRAWTLQEGFLAPRYLLFGSRVIWFCQHMTHSDGGLEDWSFDETELEQTRREFQIELSKIRKDDAREESSSAKAPYSVNQGIYNLWHRVVGSYSRRGLTYPEDKLPAISAMATEFAELTGDEYLAGLWRSNLPWDLLWSTPNAATHRAETWRAPTWSWASVEDAVLYGKRPPEDATLLAEVVSAESVPRTTAVPFGQVERARLEIKAPVIFQDLAESDDRDEASKPWLRGFGMQGGNNEREMLLEALKQNSRRMYDDKEEKFELPDKIAAVILFGKRDGLTFDEEGEADSTAKDQSWTVWGLLLKPVPGDAGEQVFERVLAFAPLHVNFMGGRSVDDLKTTIHVV